MYSVLAYHYNVVLTGRALSVLGSDWWTSLFSQLCDVDADPTVFDTTVT